MEEEANGLFLFASDARGSSETIVSGSEFELSFAFYLFRPFHDHVSRRNKKRHRNDPFVFVPCSVSTVDYDIRFAKLKERTEVYGRLSPCKALAQCSSVHSHPGSLTLSSKTMNWLYEK